jgi:uncharacterized sulfatase
MIWPKVFGVALPTTPHSGRFTKQTHKIRNGLTSSVDLFNTLVSIGYKGTNDWMTGSLAEIYGGRHDMISMLKSADAPGRPYVQFATDEVMANYFNFNSAPTHVLGIRTEDTKLGLYAEWVPPTSHIISRSIELEFYDYSTISGQLELNNTASSDPRVTPMVEKSA